MQRSMGANKDEDIRQESGSSYTSTITSKSTYSRFQELINMDILFLIFQIIADEEAAGFTAKGNLLQYSVKPRATVRLCLVCREWKNEIYSRFSLWPIISLNLAEPLEKVQAKCDQLVGLANVSPKDLYLWKIHIHDDDNSFPKHKTEEDKELCACQGGKVRLSLTNVTNLRSLYIEFTSNPAWLILDFSVLPPLSNLSTLCLRGRDSTRRPLEFDLQPLLSHIPRLETFFIGSIGTIKLDLAPLNQPLLPKLRFLELSCSPEFPSDRTMMIKFLTHTPNVEKVHLFLIWLTADFTPFRHFTLPHLRRLMTKGFSALVNVFSESMICTRQLEDFECYGWHNSSEAHFRRFLEANPTIKRVQLSVEDNQSTSYDVLNHAINLEEISILGGGGGQYLNSLYRTGAATSYGNLMPICPKLKRIRILIARRPLLHPFFEELVRTRCLPIDDIGEHGYTVAGCRALDVLTILVLCPDEVYPALMESWAWKKAEVMRISEREYQLRWRYNEYEEYGEDELQDSMDVLPDLLDYKRGCRLDLL